MSGTVTMGALKVAGALRQFIDEEALPGTGIDAQAR
jgi:hypothetical protein